MKFKYGDTLRIRNDLYTILGKIRYIDTRRRIWCKYKLVKHKNNAEFWIRWNKKRGAYQFTKLCSKAIPSDMNVVHRGYQMVIGTRGDIDIDFANVVRYEEYEDAKGVYVDKEYVSLESDAEIPKPILDKMDTIKKMRFIGPIIWFLANLLNNKR